MMENFMHKNEVLHNKILDNSKKLVISLIDSLSGEVFYVASDGFFEKVKGPAFFESTDYGKTFADLTGLLCFQAVKKSILTDKVVIFQTTIGQNKFNCKAIPFSNTDAIVCLDKINELQANYLGNILTSIDSQISKSGLIIIDDTGIMQFINDMALRIVGMNHNDLIGKHLNEHIIIKDSNDCEIQNYSEINNKKAGLNGLRLIIGSKSCSIRAKFFNLFASKKPFIAFFIDDSDLSSQISDTSEGLDKSNALLAAIPDQIIVISRAELKDRNLLMDRILGDNHDSNIADKAIDSIVMHIDRAITKKKFSSTEFEVLGTFGNNKYLEARIVHLQKDEALLLIRDISVRKNFEKALLQSEKRYRLLVEKAIMGIYIYYDNRYLYVNPAMEEITGYSRMELLSKDPNELVVQSDRKIVAKRRERLEKGEKNPNEYSLRMRKKDGSIAKVLTRVHPVEYDGIQAHLGHCLDISENSELKSQLLESQEQYKILVEHALAGVYIYGDHSCLFVNPAMIEITGYTEKELLTMDPMDFMHPDDKKYQLERMRNQIEGKKISNEYTLRIYKKSGEVAYLIIRVHPIVYKGERVHLGICLDVSENVKAQEELERSRKIFQDIAFSTGEIIWETDKNGKYVYITGRTEDVLGFTEIELIGTKPIDLMLPETKREFHSTLDRLEKRKRNITDLERWVRTKDGEKACLLTNAVPILDKNSELDGYRGVDKDITHKKEIELKLEELINTLRAKNKTIKQMSGLLPICTSCKKIRNDNGYWEQVDQYLERHASVDFSHSICPECAKKLYPDISWDENKSRDEDNPEK